MNSRAYWFLIGCERCHGNHLIKNSFMVLCEIYWSIIWCRFMGIHQSIRELLTLQQYFTLKSIRDLHAFLYCWGSLGVTTGCILPIGHNVLLPWIQTSLSKKPKIVLKESERIIWAIVLQRKADKFLPFLKAFFERPILE